MSVPSGIFQKHIERLFIISLAIYIELYPIVSYILYSVSSKVDSVPFGGGTYIPEFPFFFLAGGGRCMLMDWIVLLLGPVHSVLFN